MQHETTHNDKQLSLPEPKFGEWLRGIYASESNPRRDGMYVRTIIRRGRMNPVKFYEVTDGNGAFWMYPAQSVERIAAAPLNSTGNDTIASVLNYAREEYRPYKPDAIRPGLNPGAVTDAHLLAAIAHVRDTEAA